LIAVERWLALKQRSSGKGVDLVARRYRCNSDFSGLWTWPDGQLAKLRVVLACANTWLVPHQTVCAVGLPATR